MSWKVIFGKSCGGISVWLSENEKTSMKLAFNRVSYRYYIWNKGKNCLTLSPKVLGLGYFLKTKTDCNHLLPMLEFPEIDLEKLSSTTALDANFQRWIWRNHLALLYWDIINGIHRQKRTYQRVTDCNGPLLMPKFSETDWEKPYYVVAFRDF